MSTVITETRLDDFLSAYFSSPDEAIHLRALKPKKAPDVPEFRAEKIEVTRNRLLVDFRLQQRLKEINATRGLYFVVNSGGDNDDSITRINAFFAESDSKSIDEQHGLLDASLLQPSIRLETKKSVHAYWLLVGDCSKPDWRDIQSRLIAHFGGDEVIKNASRVMRLPFFNHISINGGPELHKQRVRLVVFEPERRFTLEDMRKVFPPVHVEKPRVEFITTGLYANWEALSAEARRRILSLPSAKIHGEWAHAKGICHDGQGDKGLAVNMATGAYFCCASCTTEHVLRALGLPEKPDVQVFKQPASAPPEQPDYLEAPSDVEQVTATGKPQGIFEVEDISEKIDSLYITGLQRGASPGWPSLERLYTIVPGEFTVVTGTSGSGKSGFLDAVMINLARNLNWRLGVCSFENQPLEKYIAYLMQIYSGLPFSDGWHERMGESVKNSARKWISEHFTFILPDDSDRTIPGILRLADWICEKKGIDGLLIDPWNEIEHLRPAGMTETEYTARALTRVRSFAYRRNVHVWLVAHPRTIYRQKDGNYPQITLYDISGSAHFKNKCDFGLVVSRDANAKNCSVIQVQKARFRHEGEHGECRLYFDFPTGRYSENAPYRESVKLRAEEDYGL